MTTTNEVFRNSYTATAGQTVFPYTFKAFARSNGTGELQVYKNGTLLSEGIGASEYAVSGLGNAGGGNVTLNTGAALNDVVVIIPDPDFIQDTTYVEGDKFPSAVTENALDRSVIRDLALREELSRKAGAAAGTSTSITFPTYSADKLLTWSPSVNGAIVNSTKTLNEVEGAVDAVAALSSGSGVLVSSNDTTVGFLNGKLVAGSNVTLTENNNGSNETLTVAVSGLGALAFLDEITSNEVPAGALFASDIATGSKLGGGSKLLTADALGTAGQVLRVDGAGTTLEFGTVSGLTLATPQNTTSGSTANFGSIPSGTKQITLSLANCSQSASGDFILQLGDSGGIETSGYTGGANSATNSTSFLLTTGLTNAALTVSGSVILTLVDSSTNTWNITGVTGLSSGSQYNIYGSKSLSGELTQVQLGTTGAGTFDAGKVNIAYA